MKILHVINDLGSGGAERLVTQLCEELSNENTVTLFSFNSSKNIFSDFQTSNLDYVTFDKDGFFSFNKVKILYGIIKTQDIVHAHLFPTFYIISILSLFLKKPKYLFTEHNTHNKRRTSSLFLSIEKFIYRNYDCVINITLAVKESLENWIGTKPSKVIIKNFVDLSLINNVKSYPRENFSISNQIKLLAMVGSFSEQKDQITIIKALNTLPNDFELILIGDGELKQSIFEAIRNLGLQKRVHIFGIRKDVFQILKFCDFGILSSNWEGFGIVALEYMACGLVTLGSNVDGLNQVIPFEMNLFNVGDFLALSKRIQEIDINNELRKTIVEAQYEFVKNFDVKESSETHLQLYKTILKC